MADGVEEEMKKLLNAAAHRTECSEAVREGRGACFFSPRATFDANLSISLGGVKRHYPLLPFPGSLPSSLLGVSVYRELVPRMRNCLKLLAPPHCALEVARLRFSRNRGSYDSAVSGNQKLILIGLTF